MNVVTKQDRAGLLLYPVHGLTGHRDHDAPDAFVVDAPFVLTWHSGREAEASPDLFDWCVAHLSQMVMEIGDLLTAATAAHRNNQERHRVDTEHFAAVAARVKHLITTMPTAEAVALAQQPVELPPDVLDLLELGERYVKENQ